MGSGSATNVLLFWLYGNVILPAQARVLSKNANTSTATLRRKAEFTVTMQSLVTNMWAFEQDYAVLFIDVLIISIIDNIMVVNFQLTSCKAFICYITDSSMMIKKEGIVSLLTYLSMIIPPFKAQLMTHLGDFTLYIFAEKVIPLTVQDTDSFVKKDYWSASYQANVFYKYGKALPDVPHDYYRSKARE